jgi:PAS domain S-box-containing protein
MDEKTIPISALKMEQPLPPEKPEFQFGKGLNYRALFDQTSECVFIIGFDLRYISANLQALNLLGYEEYEFVGLPVSNVMSLDEELTHVSILGGGSNLYERVLKRKDGTTVPVEISTTIVFNPRNEPAYIQSIARDISERKIAEQTLKRQTTILSLISDATARLLNTSHIESGIPEVLGLLGRAMSLMGCAIFDLNKYTDPPQILIQYQWVRSPGKIDLASVLEGQVGRLLACDGQPLDVSPGEPAFCIVPIQGAGGIWKYLALVESRNQINWSDSEREAIRTSANLIGSALQRNVYEEALRLSETRNRIILSALPDLLIRVDSKGMILDYNVNPNHPLYIHRDMITGHKLTETWPEDVARQILGESITLGFETNKVLERFNLPFSGREYEARLYPITLQEALIVIRDITEQVELDQMKSDFINRASHELRTPVTAAILMSELIQEGGTEEELNEYWRTLRSELNRQKILIDRLLTAGRLESGMMTLDRLPLDLTSMLSESVQVVIPIAYKRKVKVQLDRQEHRPEVIGDKSALEQVFINLLNNAIKFSPEGKTVTVKFEESDATVDIHIVDQGLGIPADALPHLFERFYRAQNVSIAEIPGSGIGLYIVKNIVEELGGRITVISEVNRGATFTVTLPKRN